MTHQRMCEQAHRLRREVDGDSHAIKPDSAVMRLGGSGSHWITAYYLLVLADEGCRSGVVRLVNFDRLPKDNEGRTALGGEDDSIPRCETGAARYVLSEGAYARLVQILSLLGKLRLTVLSCFIAGTQGTTTLDGIDSGRLKIQDVLIPHLLMNHITTDYLEIAGTAWNKDSISSQPDQKAEISVDSGTNIFVVAILGSTIGNAIIKGVRASSILMDGGEVRGAVEITRSKIANLTLQKGKFESLTIFQSQLDSINLYNNVISGDVRLGQHTSAYPGRPADHQDEVRFGPRPSWISDQAPYAPHLAIRDWLEFVDNTVGGDVTITVRLGPVDAPSSQAGRPLPGKESWINLNRLSARNLYIVGSTIYLGRDSGVHGAAISVRSELKVVGNVITRAIPRDGVYVPLRFEDPESRSDGVAFGLSDLSARTLEFAGNLIIGKIAVIGASLKALSFINYAPPEDNLPTLSQRCTVGPVGAYTVMSWLVGLADSRLSNPLPTTYAEMPICYGSVIVQGGEVDNVTAAGSMSDLLVKFTKVSNTVVVGGRVSGVVNLTQADMKDAAFLLGDRLLPLTWCDTSQLVLEGSRFRALMADQGRFLTVKCDSTAPDTPFSGQLRIALRGAKFEQVLGSPRNLVTDTWDPGLLGLDSERLIKLVSTPPAAPKPLRARLLGALSWPTSTPTDPKFDPESLTNLAGLLKMSGHVSEATDLTIARVKQQLWEGGRMSRAKYIIGWPIGWGYHLQWAFLYGFVFVGFGAWVSAYYRCNPATSPPPAPWSGAWVRIRSYRQHLRLALGRLALLCGMMLMLYFITVEAPLRITLTPRETGTLIEGVGAIVALVAVIVILLRRRKALIRFILSLEALDFHAIFFSLDRFLPAPSFHNYWGNYPRIGQSGRNYFYVHRFFGLVLVTLVTAGLAGLFD